MLLRQPLDAVNKQPHAKGRHQAKEGKVWQEVRHRYPFLQARMGVGAEPSVRPAKLVRDAVKSRERYQVVPWVTAEAGVLT